MSATAAAGEGLVAPRSSGGISAPAARLTFAPPSVYRMTLAEQRTARGLCAACGDVYVGGPDVRWARRVLAVAVLEGGEIIEYTTPHRACAGCAEIEGIDIEAVLRPGEADLLRARVLEERDVAPIGFVAGSAPIGGRA